MDPWKKAVGPMALNFLNNFDKPSLPSTCLHGIISYRISIWMNAWNIAENPSFGIQYIMQLSYIVVFTVSTGISSIRNRAAPTEAATVLAATGSFSVVS